MQDAKPLIFKIVLNDGIRELLVDAANDQGQFGASLPELTSGQCYCRAYASYQNDVLHEQTFTLDVNEQVRDYIVQNQCTVPADRAVINNDEIVVEVLSSHAQGILI